MELEEFKNLKDDELVINIKTYEFGTPYMISGDYPYVIKINERKTIMYDSCKDLYTKEQLKEIKVTSLQAVNLLQLDDFFDKEDKFICCNDYYNLKEIVKCNEKGIFVDTEEEDFLLDYNNKCMKFVPHIKPFTKKDLKSGMIVVNSSNEIGNIILNSIQGDIIQYNYGYIDDLSTYNDDLVKNCNNSKIDKIYKLKDNYSFNNYDFNDKIRYELLWSRE